VGRPLSKRRSRGVAAVAAVAAVVAAPVADAMARTVVLAPGGDDDDDDAVDPDPRSPTPRPTPSDTQTTNAAVRNNCRRVARVIMVVVGDVWRRRTAGERGVLVHERPRRRAGSPLKRKRQFAGPPRRATQTHFLRRCAAPGLPY